MYIKATETCFPTCRYAGISGKLENFISEDSDIAVKNEIDSVDKLIY